jgi:hypothetical protein
VEPLLQRFELWREDDASAHFTHRRHRQVGLVSAQAQTAGQRLHHVDVLSGRVFCKLLLYARPEGQNLLTCPRRNLLSFRVERDRRLPQTEQRPRLALEVDAVETRQRDVVAVQLHRPPEYRSELRQRHVHRAQLQAGDLRHDLLPVSVVPRVRHVGGRRRELSALLRCHPRRPRRAGETAERPLAAVELLREELFQLVEHLEQVGGGRFGDHHLELVPGEVAVHEDGGGASGRDGVARRGPVQLPLVPEVDVEVADAAHQHRRGHVVEAELQGVESQADGVVRLHFGLLADVHCDKDNLFLYVPSQRRRRLTKCVDIGDFDVTTDYAPLGVETRPVQTQRYVQILVARRADAQASVAPEIFRHPPGGHKQKHVYWTPPTAPLLTTRFPSRCPCSCGHSTS